MSAVTSASGGEPATTTEDSARQLRLRVLNDIHDDRVVRLPHGVLTVTDDTQVADGEQGAYLAEVRLLRDASWVMESTRPDRHGIGFFLRLTTIGELRRLDLLAEQAVTA